MTFIPLYNFLDPAIFGPLFRFNRDFYQLDEKGKPIGYKNLDELHRRLRPILLRRRKQDVEDQLPERTVNNYFVSMDPEQRARYDEYKDRVARLLYIAKRRLLRKEELEKLQKWLACMRMLCDTPYILDPDCRISPKLHELETILEELLTDPTVKIIIFSEWERMLQLVRELVQKMNFHYAWHTGSVPQHQRRNDIKRFKEDLNCRLFLSTDSGSVGLNLQSANIVINLDLPWNPAKLEQRIARAWRKHQTRTVQVINLVCQDSIEQRMLDLLAQKQNLAQGVLEGDGNLKAMDLPSGRAAFMQRMEALMGTGETLKAEESPSDTAPFIEPKPGITSNPFENLRTDLLARFPDRIDLLQIHHQEITEQRTIFLVIDQDNEKMREQLKQVLTATNHHTALEILDRQTFATIQRLAQAGILNINQGQTLHTFKEEIESRRQRQEKQIQEAKKQLAHAERKQRIAHVLVASDFHEEALAPLREAFEATLRSYAWLTHTQDIFSKEPMAPNFIQEYFIQQHGLPPKTLSLLTQLHPPSGSMPDVKTLLTDNQEIFQHVDEALNRVMMG